MIDETGSAGTLTPHLQAYLGTWPPTRPIEVVGWPGRLLPAWDEAQIPAVAVASPLGTVVSVLPAAAPRTTTLLGQTDGSVLTDDFRHRLGDAAGVRDHVSPWVVLRWTIEPAPLEPIGAWVPSDHEALPEWLRAFPDPVLAAFDDAGVYVGGVGIKRHTDVGHELAVGTAPEQRGRGLARRLVAQAARDVLAQGAIPLYVHSAENIASARVADAAGFPDAGWRLVVAWGPSSL